MSFRSASIVAALGLVLINGCQPTGLAPVTGDGGGGGSFVTPSPEPNVGGAATTPSPEPAGVPITLPPVQTSSPPLQPPVTTGPSASPGPTTGTSPAPFPAVSPPPSPGLGAAGGA